MHCCLCACPAAGDAVALELAAAEMAQAAAVFVALEKEMDKLRAKGADGGIIALKDTARCARDEVLDADMVVTSSPRCCTSFMQLAM
jgi:hypothetical protein